MFCVFRVLEYLIFKPPLPEILPTPLAINWPINRVE